MDRVQAKPRGPRGAHADTRADILAAALTLFAADGYGATSVRSIARAASVDPSLVRHYFESKSLLFVAALGPIEAVAEGTSRILAGPSEQLGERMVRSFLAVWDSEDLGPRLRTLLVSAATVPEVADVMREWMMSNLFSAIAAGAGPKEASEADVAARATATASQMVGIAFTRYVVRLEPIASAKTEWIVERYSASVQRLITGDLS